MRLLVQVGGRVRGKMVELVADRRFGRSQVRLLVANGRQEDGPSRGGIIGFDGNIGGGRWIDLRLDAKPLGEDRELIGWYVQMAQRWPTKHGGVRLRWPMEFTRHEDESSIGFRHWQAGPFLLTLNPLR